MNIVALINFFTALAWMGVIAAIAYTVARAARNNPFKPGGTIIGVLLLVGVLSWVLGAGLEFINPNERGVVITALPGQAGVRDEALQPGLNWIVPFFDNVVTYRVSRQTYTMSSTSTEGAISGDDSVQARTSDGQIVYVDASVIFAVDPTEVVNVHVSWQSTYVDGLVRPISRGVIRDAVSQYGIQEVYSTSRSELSDQITKEMAAKFAEEGFLMVDFVLRNISFSAEYAASVEQKQVAEQQAQQAFFVVEQRKQEADQLRQQAQGEADSTVIRAQGQADSVVIAAQGEAEARLIQSQAEAAALTLLGQAIAANPDVLTLQYIEKLSPNVNVMLLPSGNPFLFTLPGLEDGAATTIPAVTTEP